MLMISLYRQYPFTHRSGPREVLDAHEGKAKGQFCPLASLF